MQKKNFYLILALSLSVITIAGSVWAANTATTGGMPTQGGQNGQGTGQMRGNQNNTGKMSASGTAQMQGQNNQEQVQSQGQGMSMQSGISGKIASIDGDTITLESKNSYTITIDASDIDISGYEVGDFIMVTGGITVKAEEIKTESGQKIGMGTIGTVTDVSDTTITMTSKVGTEDVTYTVDASDATITEKADDGTETTLSISDVVEDDIIMVQGEISDDNIITATSISITSETSQTQTKQQGSGVWSKITNWIGNLFNGKK